ncbi:PDZ domain-containing protein [Vallitalea guaymasensis]|uniref:PDZ domain-containing protein n=1 Tax=Vallitalea guaymasensis TaxID=1185412 RepID=A0A8J8MC25_9FIRM|nr:PDZ domain-containing protein [Vallitalea guaymasensis]QUH30156.1 PDZ domain-containing protein [Vallitalea guaymasensis]
MNPLLEIIHITLLSISRALFNFSFIFVIWILYLLIKKYKSVNIYNFDNSKTVISALVESILQGIIIGIIGSLIIAIIGLPINLTYYLIFLLPLALMLSLINIRYLCFSYAASVMGVLSLVFRGQTVFGVNLPDININISGLLALVGILHLMEAILIYFVGADDPIPIVAKKDGKIVVGHLMQKYWPLPIAMLVLSSGGVSNSEIVQMPEWWPLLKDIPSNISTYFYGLMPFVGALGYSSITYCEEPKKRSRKTALRLMVYSVLLIILSIYSVGNIFLQILGTILMAGIHEGMILYEQYIESKREPIYTVPKKGVRVMGVNRGGAGDQMGIRVGDIIAKINGINVLNTRQYRAILKNGFTFLWVDVIHLDGSLDTYEFKAYPDGITDLKVRLIPENPRIIYRHQSVQKIGLFHIIRNRFGR